MDLITVFLDHFQMIRSFLFYSSIGAPRANKQGPNANIAYARRSKRKKN